MTSGSTTVPFAFGCELCNSNEKKDVLQYEASNTFDVHFPTLQLIHAHFGHPTLTTNTSTEEAEAIESHVHKVFATFKQPFFLMADLSHKDNAEFVSLDAMKVYARLQALPQLEKIVCYGVSPAMRMIINLITHIQGTHHKVHFVKSKAEAQQRYEQWFAEKKASRETAV